MRPFLDPSPRASEDNKFQSKYDFPWVELPAGKSFSVDVGEINLSTLRSMASQKGKQLDRTFRVFDHGEKGFEVYHAPAGNKKSKPEATKQPAKPNAPTSDNPTPLAGYRGFQPPPDGNGLNAPRGWPSPEEAMKGKD